MQSAVACHELLHVNRRDWVWNTLEELVRTFFWFHPGIHWLIARIQLTPGAGGGRAGRDPFGFQEQLPSILGGDREAGRGCRLAGSPVSQGVTAQTPASGYCSNFGR